MKEHMENTPTANLMSENTIAEKVMAQMQSQNNMGQSSIPQIASTPSSESVLSQLISGANAMVSKNITENPPDVSSEDSSQRMSETNTQTEQQSVSLQQEKKQGIGKITDYDKFQKRFAEIVDDKTQHNSEMINKTGLIDRNDDASYKINYQRRSPDITAVGSRAKDGIMKESDMKYNVISYHTVPPNLNTGSFEYGYSFLPPKDWYPTPPFPPVCVAEKQCPVCPVLSSSEYVDLKEWNSARRFTPADEINVKYVEEKLNSGR
jgi:hypothetical protein